MLIAKQCGTYAGEKIYSVYKDYELLDTLLSRELCQDIADTADEPITFEEF